MTFKEKLQMEHPENVSERFVGECYQCPIIYHYEKDLPCFCVGEDKETCRKCWNREMPNTEPKEVVSKEMPNTEPKEVVSKEEYFNVGYNNGLADAWELAKRLYEFTCDELEEIFGVKYGFHDLISKYNSQEALAKLKAYEDSKIEVGDVVILDTCKFIKYIVLTVSDNEAYMYSLTPDGTYPLQRMSKANFDAIKKTGKHIDIKSILEQIGE